MDLDRFLDALAACDPDRSVFTPHFYERARRRNIDARAVRQKIEELDVSAVRDNPCDDPRFERSYRVTVTVGGEEYEMPVYFNVPGTKVVVKSVWPR